LIPPRPGDDLATLSGLPVPDRAPNTAVTPEKWGHLEARVRRAVRMKDDFVTVPFPRLAAASDRQVVAAVEQYRREAAVVDPRLAREVSLQLKAAALSDVCDRLRSDSGIQLVASNSVADEKVTVFCEKQPLRDVMRQLSRPFGYTWLRSGTPGAYRYELVQDLKSQFMEEELRNRDRNAALVALDQEIERYRPLLALSPDEALLRAKTAAPVEKKLLGQLSGLGWGPIQMYFRLSPQEQAALRAGQELRFSAEPMALFDRPLPANVARGVLQSLRDRRIRRLGDGSLGVTTDSGIADARPPADVPEARAIVTLKMKQSELGRFTLAGQSGFFARSKPDGGVDTANSGDDGPLANGTSPAVHKLDNAAVNARFARDPSLRRRVTVVPRADLSPAPGVAALLPPARGGVPVAGTGLPPASTAPSAENGVAADISPPSPRRGGAGGEVPPEPKVTTADVLEALHRATGMPIVADFYTRLYPADAVTLINQPLFEALNRLGDTMRLRWNKDGSWLQFRSSSYYDDRLKEVPNRLLNRWAAARRQHGMLSLDELVEIVQLPDAPLDGAEMAEGARLLFGLAEWDLARNWALRRHLRYLAGFTPAQRQEAMSPAGLAFARMPLAQQQRFIAIAHEWDEKPLQSLEELEGAVLRVDYTQPGWYEWRVPGAGADWLQLVMPAGPGRRAPRPALRARTRQAVLQTARQLDSQLQEAMLQVARRLKPDLDAAQMAAQEAQVVPTELNLTFLYMPGGSHARVIRSFSLNNQSAYGTW
jgi:hypothetical protein